jgi:hypothetical protein
MGPSESREPAGGPAAAPTSNARSVLPEDSGLVLQECRTGHRASVSADGDTEQRTDEVTEDARPAADDEHAEP